MLDELERLRSSEKLGRLLAHYACLHEQNPHVWQDRLMCLADAELIELSRLHGELIAFGWIDQNTGQTSDLTPGMVRACYRVTAAGVRALQPNDSGPLSETTVAGSNTRHGAMPTPRRSRSKRNIATPVATTA